MQKLTQKWTVISLLEPMADGTEYFWKDWPVHITLADVFAIGWNGEELVENLAMSLADQKPVETTAGDDTLYGPADYRTKVTLIENTPELQKLHEDIIGLLQDGGVVFNSPQYVGEGYIPHSTVQKHGRLKKGDVVKIGSLTIVDMFPHGDGYRRRLVKTIKLSK
jgi:2'-5' RNA ligase